MTKAKKKSPRQAGTGARSAALELTALTAVSPIDGRYADRTAALRPLFSEYGLIRHRLLVEIRWLQFLAAHRDIRELPALSPASSRLLESIIRNFTPEEAARVKQIEARTNHDVKAVEYYLREKTAGNAQLEKAAEFFHFACTSEDINNLAYGLMLSEGRRLLDEQFTAVTATLGAMASRHARLAMLARTHGQPASPTTLGKELGIFAHRLDWQLEQFRAVQVLGKFNGAVGNFNAHMAAYPELDWMAISRKFVISLGLQWNPHTTQIEPHDWMAEYFHALVRINTVLIDLCRDMWGYISLGYFRQRAVAREVGSSTMPHKVNPIDFENAEGNLALSASQLVHLASKLPVSRWQRDLTDSTTLRTVGSSLAHALIAAQACQKGFSRLTADPARIKADLAGSWEVLAEALQTVMRRHGVPRAYERLKKLTRGGNVSAAELRSFIRGLELPVDVKRRLAALTPETYTGNAAVQARRIGARTRG